jgi:hypothetical protein
LSLFTAGPGACQSEQALDTSGVVGGIGRSQDVFSGLIRPGVRKSEARGRAQWVVVHLLGVELCRQGKNFDVMRTMYAPDIVSVEGDGKETTGQDPVIKKSEDWVSDKTFNGETVSGPFFNGANPDQFVVFFALDITPKAIPCAGWM